MSGETRARLYKALSDLSLGPTSADVDNVTDAIDARIRALTVDLARAIRHLRQDVGISVEPTTDGPDVWALVEDDRRVVTTAVNRGVIDKLVTGGRTAVHLVPVSRLDAVRVEAIEDVVAWMRIHLSGHAAPHEDDFADMRVWLEGRRRMRRTL